MTNGAQTATRALVAWFLVELARNGVADPSKPIIAAWSNTPDGSKPDFQFSMSRQDLRELVYGADMTFFANQVMPGILHD